MSRFIFKCDFCDQHYCGDCSTSEHFSYFCSIECEERQEEEDKIEESPKYKEG